MTTPLDKVPSGVDRGLSRWLSQVRDAVTSLQKATAGSKIVATKRNITVPAPVLLSVVRTYKSQSTIPPQDQSDAQNQPIVCDLTFSEAPYTIQIARGITTTVPGNAPIMGTTNSLYFEDSNSPGPDAAYFVRYISTPWGNTAWTGPFPITVDAAPDGKVVTGTPPSVDDAVGWEPNTNYDQNTIIVTPAPNSYAQVVTTPGTSGATAPTWNNTPGGTTTDGTVTWTNAGYVTYSQILTSHTLANVAFNYRGAWNSGASFLAGDEVVYGPTYWLAVVPNSNSVPSTSNANWVAMGSYSGFEGVWNSASTFAPGAEVIYGGAYWISLVANTNSPPSVSNPNWQVAGIVGSSASFNVTASGWYEIALSDNSQYADYRCGFNVDASVFNGGTQGTCTFKVTSDSTGAQAALTQLHGAPGTAITQARVRIDGANHTALDIYVNWGSGTLNLAVTVTPIQGAWNSAAAQGGLAATAGTVKQTINLDPAGTGGNGGGWAHIGPGGKFHLMLDSGDVYHGAGHVLDPSQNFVPGLDLVPETPSGTYARIKSAEITAGQWDASKAGNPNSQAQYLSAVTGNQVNLIPDSGLKSPGIYWPDHSGGLITVTQNLDGHNNCFEYVGTGAASGYLYRASLPIPVDQNTTYTLSANVVGGNITSGSASVAIYNPAITTSYGSLSISSSSNGRIHTSITIPAGVSQVVVIFDTSNCTVSSGYGLFCQQIQLEVGSVMTAFRESTGDNLNGSLGIDFSKTLHANKTINNVGDDPAGVWLRFKGTQQATLLTNPAANHILDPGFTSIADFWGGTNSASAGVLNQGTVAASGFSNNFNYDGRGNKVKVKLDPGDTLVLQLTSTQAPTGTASTYLGADFQTAAGAHISYTNTAVVPATGTGTGTSVTTAPATCAYAYLFIETYGGASGGNAALVTSPKARINHEALIDKGSGIQLGDPRNGRALFTAGVQYYLSGMGLTNPSSGTINCASGTLLMGGSGTGNVAYNASSVTGLTNGTTYYCYYLDPGFTGGSKTLNVTATKTDLSGNPDIVYIGYITPASGGGGGGGTGGCVYADAYLDTADGSLVQAKDATQGLMLNAQLDDGTFTQLPILNVPYMANEPCVQLATADGSLILSDMTPVNCAKGPFPAFDTVHETVTTRAAGKTGTGVVTGASFVGACPVVRISLGGASFGAGQLPNGYFIYTHNVLKP